MLLAARSHLPHHIPTVRARYQPALGSVSGVRALYFGLAPLARPFGLPLIITARIQYEAHQHQARKPRGVIACSFADAHRNHTDSEAVAAPFKGSKRYTLDGI